MSLSTSHVESPVLSSAALSRPLVPPRSSSYHYPVRSSSSGHSSLRGKPRSLDLAKDSSSTIECAIASRSSCEELSLDARPSLSHDAYPFPLQPMPAALRRCRSSLWQHRSRQRPIAPKSLPTPPPTPDRFIPARRQQQETSRSFRLSKSPEQLSPAERIHRSNAVSSDPFSSRRIASNPNRLGLESQSAPHGEHATAPTQLRHPGRHASAGAVWNIGGGAATNAGRVTGVADGRGGILGSGTNAPMFSSRFFDTESPDQSLERFEGRLAAALDIDQTTRVLSTSQLAKPAVDAASTLPLTTWEDGAWISGTSHSSKANPFGLIAHHSPLTRPGKSAKIASRAVPTTPFRVLDAPSLRDDFYCSVLAYCHTNRTLAVGLNNRVYLWSEISGVQYPRPEENLRNVYVTSLSFSSWQGGHSILATGRSNGQVALWSLFDENDRFQAQQPHAVACVAFKPIPTRRYSDHSRSNVSTEELLVGDELGVIYYYSVEWPQQPSGGNMILMAKIEIHTQQICGIAWSPDGDCFATGGNDNVCCLFEVHGILTPPPIPVIQGPLSAVMTGLVPDFVPNAAAHHTLSSMVSSAQDNATSSAFRHTRPIFVPGRVLLTVSEGQQRHKWVHSAAVKAIAFCPWQRGLLATGGGSNDRAIHFYHATSGACLATIHVQAQVTSLIWSKTRREIAATFGYAQPEHPYRIAVYSWPDCRQVVAIPWTGDMRALFAIAYPGGPNEASRQRGEGGRWWSRTAEEGCLVVASSDESVKFHEVWSEARKSTGGPAGLLGSDILQGLEGIDRDGPTIR